MPIVKEHYHEVASGDLGDPPVIPDPGDAAGLSYDNGASDLTATDVQAALDEIVSTIPSQAAFVDPMTATAGEIAQALIDAGLMASS